MKMKNFAKGLLFGASLLLASAAFAGEKATVKLYDDVKVNGKTLTPGDYQLAWEGTGGDVQVSIRQGKNIIATIPPQVETSSSSAPSTGYSTKQADDGSKSLTNVFFSGKKYSLNLAQQAATATAPAASTSGNK
jgi:hypothetical protein